MPAEPASGHLLVDREIAALCGSALRAAGGAAPIERAQIQPSSVDLRLGARAVRIRASFLPGAASLEDRLAELALATLDLRPPGAVLERGGVYLIELAEELALPGDLRASFNPRSSAGRSDLFTRVVVPGHARFDRAPAGYRGRLWAEVAPLSFSVRLAAGDRLCQMRLERGRAALAAGELEEQLARTPLVHGARGPLDPAAVRIDEEGGLALHLGLAGRAPAGWRAREARGVLEFGAEGVHELADFWDPLEAPGGHCLLPPGGFQLFASRERIAIPPELAAEMLPIDTGLGEMRNNYAGFFDNGFGWPHGTPAVLEVRAHDVPFLVEDGQVFFRLRFYRTGGRPERLYAEGRERASYRDQDLTPARCFRPPRKA